LITACAVFVRLALLTMSTGRSVMAGIVCSG
jgi:hypothetical protein